MILEGRVLNDIQNLVLLCRLVLKKNQILTSIKDRNSVANMRKTKIFNTNVGLVNDIVYTKIWSQSVYSFSSYLAKTKF